MPQTDFSVNQISANSRVSIGAPSFPKSVETSSILAEQEHLHVVGNVVIVHFDVTLASVATITELVVHGPIAVLANELPAHGALVLHGGDHDVAGVAVVVVDVPECEVEVVAVGAGGHFHTVHFLAVLWVRENPLEAVGVPDGWVHVDLGEVCDGGVYGPLGHEGTVFGAEVHGFWGALVRETVGSCESLDL